MKRMTLGATGLALMLMVVGVSDAEAQRPIRVGVIGGVNMSSAWGDDAEDAESKTGFDIGGLVQIPMGDMITIQPELHYTQKGFEVTETILGEEFEFELSLDYIQIPVLLRAGLPLAEGFDFDFLVGPSFGFLMSCSGSVEGESEDCPDDTVKGFDYGVLGGFGFSWATGPGDVLVDFRYDLGLTAIYDEDNSPDVKNTNMQLLIGYAFPM